MKLRRFLPILFLFVGLNLTVAATDARAADEESDEIRSYTEGPTVRRKLLYRSSRLELQPLLGMTTGNAYMHDGVVGLSASYYLTNEIGLGITAGYGLLHPETSMAKNIKTTLGQKGDDTLDALSFSYLQWMAGLEFEYVPIFGKFSVLNAINASYDIHLLGGLTLIGRNSCSAHNPEQGCLNASGDGASILKGLRPAATIGVGMRLFLGEAYAVNFQVRDHLYQRAEVSTQNNASPKFSNNFMVSLGFSLFFPQSVKISK